MDTFPAKFLMVTEKGYDPNMFKFRGSFKIAMAFVWVGGRVSGQHDTMLEESKEATNNNHSLKF